MIDDATSHAELLNRVAERLRKTSSATDHQMLIKWRVQSIAQYLFGRHEQKLKDICRTALESFATHGPSAASDETLKAANDAVKVIERKAETVLPLISADVRAIVMMRLDELAASGQATLDRALQVLPELHERIRKITHATSTLGIRYRFESVSAIVESDARSEIDRIRAAAAVLYVDEEKDVTPDSLGVIGMIDDDFALRVVLEEITGASGNSQLHWSERIGSLWDELPFLRGVNLKHGENPITITWLDRINSYTSYSHVMRGGTSPMVLLQPSIICSPLHTIITLMGLLVFDAVTSSQSKARSLSEGQTYEFDKLVARFEGIAGPPEPGWLRLRMRDGVVYHPPVLADRMVPVKARRLSCLHEFSSQSNTANTDPIQLFFDWNAAIGSASISSHLILVASRRRAMDLFADVQSNGVKLLNHGLVRFISEDPKVIETHGALVLVVPSLSTARLILNLGLNAQAIMVDGYQQLHRGRHELPFLINRQCAPSIIGWSVRGYYPVAPLTWLEPYELLDVPPDDLAAIMELENISTDSERAVFWRAATNPSVQICITQTPVAETALVRAIDDYLKVLHSSQAIPEFWKFQLGTSARTLRTLVSATPSEWSKIRSFAETWSSSFEEKRSSLRSSARAALTELLQVEKCVLELIKQIPDAVNSRATALASFLSDTRQAVRRFHLVCGRPEQIKAATSAIQALNLHAIEPILLQNLEVGSACLVTGWTDSSFARRLLSHTPLTIIALTDDIDGDRWKRAIESQRDARGKPLLGAIGGIRSTSKIVNSSSAIPEDQEHIKVYEDNSEWNTDERVPCLFLSVAGQSDAKVLEPSGHVVVEEDEVVRERVAAYLRPDDRVILGIGASRWSPADEFTSAVVDAVEESHPELVKMAKEWRRALRECVEVHDMSVSQLRAKLASMGVEREEQTIVGWLDPERASPISPRRPRIEFAALWPLIEQYVRHSLEDVADACIRLRVLRAAAGHALLRLWKGDAVEVGVDSAWLDDLVERLREEVHVYEIEAITEGTVPRMMLGWWIPSTLVDRFERNASMAPHTFEMNAEKDDDSTRYESS